MKRDSRSQHTSFTTLRNRKSRLMGFKEFVSFSTPSSPSEVFELLLDEDDNLSVVLRWALEKLTKEMSELGHRVRRSSFREQAWLVKC